MPFRPRIFTENYAGLSAKSVQLKAYNGRFGNHLFEYCFARKLAEKLHARLHVPASPLTILFGLEHPQPEAEGPGTVEIDESIHSARRRCDCERLVLRGFFQQPHNLIYSRSEARAWLQFKPEYQMPNGYSPEAVAHLRNGDLLKMPDMQFVSWKSYDRMAERLGIKSLWNCSEEFPMLSAAHPEYPYLFDFQIMQRAKILLRAPSTFSWWAATLGKAIVYSPRVDFKRYGEQDCEFEPGNHCAWHPSVKDAQLL